MQMKPLPDNSPCTEKAPRNCPQSPHEASGPQPLKSRVGASKMSWWDVIHSCRSLFLSVMHILAHLCSHRGLFHSATVALGHICFLSPLGSLEVLNSLFHECKDTQLFTFFTNQQLDWGLLALQGLLSSRLIRHGRDFAVPSRQPLSGRQVYPGPGLGHVAS